MKFLCYTAIITAGLGLSGVASAQEASFSAFDNHRKVSTTAGFHITVPFGGKHAEQVQDRARFGLMLNLSREYNGQNFAIPKRTTTNLLDFGWQFDGRPTMLLGGADIYTPLFTPLSAHEKHDTGIAGTGISKNTILIIAGGALAVGAAVALAGGDDDDDYDDYDDD
ncbi:MAG: hypothetical protein JKY25_05855 [Robiginitomaculum sp.]|nr:hypothetical protein [Robiginitomaculum sp.]